jgi:hypothetical protein
VIRPPDISGHEREFAVGATAPQPTLADRFASSARVFSDKHTPDPQAYAEMFELVRPASG